MDCGLDGTQRDEVAREAEPDHAPRRADPIHLREHVAEHVGEREDDKPGRKDTPRDLDELHGDDVRDDERGDEDARDDDEPPGVLHPIRSSASPISSSVIVRGGVALMSSPSSPAGVTITPRPQAAKAFPLFARRSPAPCQPEAAKRSPPSPTRARSAGTRSSTTSAAAHASGFPMCVWV